MTTPLATARLARRELILGGQKSGKSRRAEQLAAAWLAQDARHDAVLVATATAHDAEMRARIARHQADRAARLPALRCVEEPLALAAAITAHSAPHTLVLVDCLTLWLTNLMMEGRDIAVQAAALAAFLPQAKARLVIVSNEVGLGIVPENRMAREFRDHAGRLHQMIAAKAAEVYFVAAGLPLKMKG